MDFYILSKTVLFQGATPEETEQMLSCLKAGKRKYKKEEMIYRVGEVVSCIGIVLSGSVLIENDDIAASIKNKPNTMINRTNN